MLLLSPPTMWLLMVRFTALSVTASFKAILCRPSMPTSKPFNRILSHRLEEVKQVAVGISEQHRTVPPRHRGRFLYPIIDKWLQTHIFGLDIVDAELNND